MRYTIFAVLMLSACSPSGGDTATGEDAASADDSGLTFTIGASEVPDKLYVECKLPMMFGEMEATETRTFIEFEGRLRNYSASDNEIDDNCSPMRDGCRDSIEDGFIISERTGFGDVDKDSIVRVNLDTLEASMVELVDGAEVPSDDEVTCTKPDYPESVTDGFRF